MAEVLKIILPFIGRCEKLRFLIKIQSQLSRKKMFLFTKIVNTIIYKRFHCDISPYARIGKNIIFPHPIGIVIGEGVTIGDYVTIYQNVTLGREESCIKAYPTIEDNVVIYTNSIVIGDVVVRKRTVVGAYSLVNRDTSENSVCIGIPAKCTTKKEN